MGFLSYAGRATASDVNSFHASVSSFRSAVSNGAETIGNEIKDLTAEVAEKANELHKLSSECADLYEEIKKKIHEIEQHVSSLTRQLASTPKTIEKTVTNSDGSTKTVKEANPEHAQVQHELTAEKARLSRAKELSWKVYNKRSELQRQAQYVSSLHGEMEAAGKRTMTELGSLAQKAARADATLTRTEEAVREYVSVSWY